MNEHDNAQLEATLRTIEGDTSAAAKPNKGAKQPLARALIQQVLDGEALLFHDQFHDGYIAPQGDGAEVLRLRSRQFRTWLHYYTHTVLGHPLNPTVALEVIYTLEGHARHEGPLYPLTVRVASHDGRLWYDLGRQAVQVTEDGWEVVEHPPMLFRRFNHQQAQVMPQRGGTLLSLTRYCPLR